MLLHQFTSFDTVKRNRFLRFLKEQGEQLYKQLFTLREAEITIQRKGNKTIHTYRIIDKS